ncbi:MAG: toll/interleukin-1 receptor domain-containing protein, partial [Phaeodactylibacter sp.]|nr:toll/interleukin-1 receptor domain-containing protein [Phaeodactylibacter sp.]
MRIHSLFKERKRLINIFFSYASEDEALQQQLENHLSIFRQNEAVSLWHKRKINPGEDWQEKVHEGMVEADVILLLASADYVSSDYLWQREMLLALSRHERGEALVAPVLLRPLAGLEEAPFGSLQPLPFNRKPATKWATLDEAFAELAGELITLLERKYTGLGATSAGFRRRYNWRLILEGALEGFSPIRRREIELALWKLSGDPGLEVLEVEEGSVQLSILSSEATYERIKAAYEAGILEEKLSVQVVALSEPIGAAIRVETKIVDGRKEG